MRRSCGRALISLLLASAALILLVPAGTLLAVDTCVECHEAQSDRGLSRQVKEVAGDVHGRAGLSCHSCHAGDPTTGMDDPYESMDPKKGYLGQPKPSAIASMCARCHADAKFMREHAPALPVDQQAKFAVSPHARSAARDEPGAASCSSCHRAHGVLPASDPRSTVHPRRVPETCGRCHADPAVMTPKNLPVDPLLEYTASVHWKAVQARDDRSAPVCHDCHGNHAAATPPPAAVVNVCGRCHTAERAAFTRGRHVAAPGFRGCVECHSNHRVEKPTDALLAPAGVCLRCHREPGPAQDEARTLNASFTTLDADIARTAAELEPLALHVLPVAEPEEHLRAARQQLLEARRLVHSDDVRAISAAVTRGADSVLRAREAMSASAGVQDQRRRGAFIFAILALVTAFTMAAKVRQMWPPEAGPKRSPAAPDQGAGAKKPKRRNKNRR